MTTRLIKGLEQLAHLALSLVDFTPRVLRASHVSLA
jgi:hypothetical protein